jgi:fructokinase
MLFYGPLQTEESMKKLYGGLEGGGTKYICTVGIDPEQIVEEVRFPTTTPAETIGRAVAFFKKFDLSAIGLATFGPLDLDPASPTYGTITASPKPGWSNTDILGEFHQAFELPVALDTDVNAAAFGEWYWVPANKVLESLVYFTIGTGIGAGLITNGCLVHGLTHPEAGHMRLPHDRKKDPFPGICPFHGDCFEGLASGPAIARHWRQAAELLPDDHPAWELEASYIAYALVNTILQVSPQRIVLGGGVMEHRTLFPAIRRKVAEILNGYVSSPVFTGSLEEYIIPPSLGKRSGVLGAMGLAKLLVHPRSGRRPGP